MALAEAMTQGLAAAGALLASLVPGRELELQAGYAVVNPSQCSACRSCISGCPYDAIAIAPGTSRAEVNRALCAACGTCVATCPTGAIDGRQFSQDQILAEIEGLLA